MGERCTRCSKGARKLNLEKQQKQHLTPKPVQKLKYLPNNSHS